MSESITQTAQPSAVTAVRRAGARFAELTGSPVRWVARAPACLDVMGGIAELSGALTLATPSREAVHVAVAPRDDQRIRVIVLTESSEHHESRNGKQADRVWELSAFYDGDDLRDAKAFCAQFTKEDGPVQRTVAAGAYALLAERIVPHLAGGFTIVIEWREAVHPDAQLLASIQGAVSAAICRALNIEFQHTQLANACWAAHTEMFNPASGAMTLAAPLLGNPGELLQVCCNPLDVCKPLQLPEGFALLGIESNARHRAADDKYANAITTAWMGREIIAKLMPVVCKVPRWSGSLARVSITDFVDQLRDRIPTKIKGSQYLERFGPLEDAPTPVQPGLTYKVRSRAEHHIYEDDRVRQFADRLTRARRSGDDEPITEAGELMYASHWSYGQRCGLGSIETDLLVSFLRGEGPKQGVYGARVTGRGCGGTVVTLIRDGVAARSAVDRALRAYTERTGLTPRLRPSATSGDDGFVVEQLA